MGSAKQFTRDGIEKITLHYHLSSRPVHAVDHQSPMVARSESTDWIRADSWMSPSIHFDSAGAVLVFIVYLRVKVGAQGGVAGEQCCGKMNHVPKHDRPQCAQQKERYHELTESVCIIKGNLLTKRRLTEEAPALYSALCTTSPVIRYLLVAETAARRFCMQRQSNTSS